ncbi:BQ5605_C051g12551 [Microbotryum silenes-dioicae]|uniref:BQ5605_C051g12551 protein n=1 Tax=Microbotryum silenes-dioicae TaxID=796604 RepID=A0A2X0NGJ0_9BASI|nr:BQ5605_C051g12551 [Microbotryum silenes-dioicae]
MEAHRKLGHQSPAAIVLAVKSGAITGITLKDEKVTPCFFTKVPHALYRVFINLGFVKHPNHHGDTIYLAIVEQYSTAKWMIVLKDKRAEMIIKAWSKFQPESEQFTAPYTPEQNGQVEQLNGSLMGLVRSMLLDSGLPMQFWSDALAVATFVLNLLLGKKPSLAHLQPFGSTVFVHVPKERRSKLAFRSIQGVFIRYSGEYNYRVWVQLSQQVYVLHHVTFLETPSVFTLSQDRADASDPFAGSTASSGGSNWSWSTGGGDLAVVPCKDDNNGPDNYHDAEEPLNGEAEVALAPCEGYAIVCTGPNPGQFENVDPSNNLPAGSCC